MLRRAGLAWKEWAEGYHVGTKFDGCVKSGEH